MIDPEPYVEAYAAIVFLLPWLVFMSFVIRRLLHAKKLGVSLLTGDASVRIRALRGSDQHAAYLYQRSRQWLIATLVAWVVGFIVLGGSLFLLHRGGVL